ncbi:glycine cleavage system aminomethyltransferase GcvT [Halalkalibaculum sp. DA384]|uniref:glycine cleavage system aminomethyltransferase GcvT n=1 Tax=Halalkalibaculum sp. DA384 TaxID=3373606 RepID=UPI003753EAF6
MSKRTPFYTIHQDLGARLVDFGGYDMPVRYGSITKEHQAVRNGVGLFDVSHMGEFYVHGPEALQLVQHVTINDASRLKENQAQYSAMCYEDGGIVDDLLVYRLSGGDGYILVVNASNIEKDLRWIRRHNTFEAEVKDQSADTCLLAVQGPQSVETLQKLTDIDLSAISFYHYRVGKCAGFEDVVFSATGYTGEKGFEIYFDQNQAEPEAIWNSIMEAGAEFGIRPCGLGARDTLRLEMGYALYGNDITKDTNPLEAGLGWLTKPDKGEFIGRTALQKIKEEGVQRRLVGFTVEEDRAIPRSGYRMLDSQGNRIGFVTSGSQSITLGIAIGMGYVDRSFSGEGTKVFIEIRNKRAEATVVRPPFISKK